MQDEIFDEEYENGGFLTPDCEDYEQLSDDELFFDNELKSTRLSVRISSPQAFSTDDFLAQIVEFPYEFRHYLDTRRAFSKALSSSGRLSKIFFKRRRVEGFSVLTGRMKNPSSSWTRFQVSSRS